MHLVLFSISLVEKSNASVILVLMSIPMPLMSTGRFDCIPDISYMLPKYPPVGVQVSSSPANCLDMMRHATSWDESVRTNHSGFQASTTAWSGAVQGSDQPSFGPTDPMTDHPTSRQTTQVLTRIQVVHTILSDSTYRDNDISTGPRTHSMHSRSVDVTFVIQRVHIFS